MPTQSPDPLPPPPDISAPPVDAVLGRATQHHNAEAAAFYRRSLTMRERRLGSDHPGLVPHLQDLAAVLEEMERSAEADSLAARVAGIQRQ